MNVCDRSLSPTDSPRFSHHSMPPSDRRSFGMFFVCGAAHRGVSDDHVGAARQERLRTALLPTVFSMLNASEAIRML